MKTMPKWTWQDFRLCFALCTYVLMYVKRLLFVYVCGGFSYLCVFVKPAIFVYIREPFSFWPTFCEDFGFDVMFLCMYLCIYGVGPFLLP